MILQRLRAEPFSQDCQSAEWKSGHRHECKVFRTLYPSVLPNTVRLVLRLLLSRQTRAIPEEAWDAFIALRSHEVDLKGLQSRNEDGLTTWQTIELMSRAALKYSGTKENVTSVQDMLARVMVNSHTLTNQTLDPLGICLEPQTALLNHSCVPNSYLVFDGPRLSLRSLEAISAGVELQISYSDSTVSTAHRRADLQSRYFFTCMCPACSKGITNGQPDPPQDPQLGSLISKVAELQAKATTSLPQEAGEHWHAALSMLQDYPPYQQPHASILHLAFLNAIACQNWVLALRRALIAYFYIEPVQYPKTWHPIRVVRKWVLLRIVMQIAIPFEDDEPSVKVWTHFGIDWQLVAVSLWTEVYCNVVMSHGRESSFAKEITIFGQGMGFIGSGPEARKLLGELSKADIRKQWIQLRKVVDSNALDQYEHRKIAM